MPMLRDQKGELWLRPSPRITLFELQRLIRQHALHCTPRLGVRDATHPTKGYAPGQHIKLRIYDSKGEQQHETHAVVEAVTIYRLDTITRSDLAGCEPTLRNWQDVQVVLSFFEGHTILPDAPVTLISFTYPS